MLNPNPTHTLLSLDSFRSNRTLSLLFTAIFAFTLTSCDMAPDWLKPEPPPEPPSRILDLDPPPQKDELPSQILDLDDTPKEDELPSQIHDPDDPNGLEETPSDIVDAPDPLDEDPSVEIPDIDISEPPPSTGLLTTPPIHIPTPGEVEDESTETETGTPLSDTGSPSDSSEGHPASPVEETVLTDSSIPVMEEQASDVEPILEVSESYPENVVAELQALPPFPEETIEEPVETPLAALVPIEIPALEPDTHEEPAEERLEPLPFPVEPTEPLIADTPSTLQLDDLPLAATEANDENTLEPLASPFPPEEIVQENITNPPNADPHDGRISVPVLETLLPPMPSELAAELPEPEQADPLSTFGVAMTAQEGELVPDDPTELPDAVAPEETTQTETTEPIADDPEEANDEEGEEDEEEEPFDPIRENGEIFTDWPDPSLALIITGYQNGYLEPCGCAGLDRMKGGLSRRMTLFSELEVERGWPTIGLDVGGLCKSFGRQAELKFHTSVEAMTLMDYSAIGLGGNDLRLPAQELYARTTSTGSMPSAFMSANVAVYGFSLEDMRPYDIIQKNGWTIGVTSVLGDQAREELINSDIETLPAHDQLAEIVPQMLESQCDALVLLAYATMEETEALAAAFPNFNIVATSSGDYEPPTRPRQLNGGRTVLVEVGEKGMNAVVFGFYSEPRKQIRYQRVPLDSRFEAADKARMLMEQYQDQLQRIGFEGLGLRPSPHPDAIPNGKFVGSKACDSCHGESYDVWKDSGHSHAWATLQDLETPRIYDPECVSCHVVGWDPEEYFPYENGFWSEESTPKLVNVGCESCHGPGENHIDAEIRGNEATQLSMRAAMRLTVEEADQSQCITCHDLDNSPDFDFDTYWPRIIHDEGIGEYED